SGFSHTLLGGWQISGITVAQSGNPFSVTTNGLNAFGDNAGVGNGTGTGSRPDLVGNPKSGFSANQDPTERGPLAYNPAAFAVPFPFEWSNMPPMHRRTFIGTSVAATLAAAAKPAWAADTAHLAGRSPVAHAIDRVGLQLYTVRDAMKTDFAGTIAKVAATGYKDVEFAGYFDHSPKDVRAILDKNSLASPSCHVGYDVVEKKWPETLEAAKIVAHGYIICPWIDEKQRKNPDGWKRAADLFNKAGEASKKAGIQFGYHNHSFEFDP